MTSSSTYHNGALSWLELIRRALQHNVQVLMQRATSPTPLMAVVKAEAYGHGAVDTAREVLAAGASWLAVFSVAEALALRAANIDAPIVVLGPTLATQYQAASDADLRLTLAGPEALEVLLQTRFAAQAKNSPLKLHIKVETGTHRQGFMAHELAQLKALQQRDDLQIEGLYSHFADIEDTTDHSYAREQLRQFHAQAKTLQSLGIHPKVRHMACSAAVLLFPETHFDLLRTGISLYGLWPSHETLVSARQRGAGGLAYTDDENDDVDKGFLQLRPVMAWKTRIAQVKNVAAGCSVAYGRTFETTRSSTLAVLPIGYSNGYPRALSNRAHVLVRGQQAALAGRVMMNMIVVDVTDISAAQLGDEVVLLGEQGGKKIRADDLAAWAGTINYEIVTRAEPRGLRLWLD